MNIQKTILTCAIAALGLVGCGTEEQDGGSSSRSGETSTLSSGVVVDGPIIRASVFEDLNGNLKRDSFEPSALTDNDGYFNVNPVKKVVYCPDLSHFGTYELEKVEVSIGQHKFFFTDSVYKSYEYTPRDEFCLKISTGIFAFEGDANIIVTGGYDLYTGEPFEGSMAISASSRKLDESSLSTFRGPAYSITPFSTITSSKNDGVTAYLKTLGIEDSSENLLDPLNADGTTKADGDFKAKNFAITYQMHKFVTVIDAWAKSIYTEIDDHIYFPSDINSLIYKQFENLDKKDYVMAWEGLSSDINSLYLDAGLSAPREPTATELDKFKANLEDVNTAIEVAFGYDSDAKTVDSTLTFANVKARVRGVEVVVLKIIRGMDYASALAALSDSNYLQNLAGDTTDENKGSLNFTQLVEFEGSEAGLVNASITAAISSGASLGSLAGKSLQFSDDDPEVNSQVAIFFTGETDASRGDIHMCFQYDENALKDSSVKLEGNYISGDWEAVEVLNNTVVLNMDIFGGTSAVLKKIEAGKYRFDYAGKITKFNSDTDFDVTGDETEIPKSNDTCKVLLGLDAVQEQLPL